MSRSFKKPWVKDPSNSSMKKIAARVYRRRTRQITAVFQKHVSIYSCRCDGNLIWCDCADEPQYPHRNSLVDQYDVCDFISNCRGDQYFKDGHIPK